MKILSTILFSLALSTGLIAQNCDDLGVAVGDQSGTFQISKADLANINGITITGTCNQAYSIVSQIILIHGADGDVPHRAMDASFTENMKHAMAAVSAGTVVDLQHVQVKYADGSLHKLAEIHMTITD